MKIEPRQTLYPPYIPQMNGDGVIDANDLLANHNKVLVAILPYSNQAVFDTITLTISSIGSYSHVVLDTELDQGLIVFDYIEGALFADGLYFVYYSIMDVAGNMSYSAAAICLIERYGNVMTLPAPVFVDAVSDSISADSIFLNKGTNVAIRSHSEFKEGMTVVFQSHVMIQGATGVDIVPGSAFSYQKTLTAQDISSGFSFLIPESYLLQSTTGTLQGYYFVDLGNNSVGVSELAEALLNISVSPLLPAPIIIGAEQDGILTADEFEMFVPVNIAYPLMVLQQQVDVFFTVYDGNSNDIQQMTSSLKLTAENVNDGQVTVVFPSNTMQSFKSGRVTCYYLVGSLFSHAAYSLFTSNVQVKLPAPVFEDAQNGILTSSDVSSLGYAMLRVAYNGMQLNDAVTVTIWGKDNGGTSIDGASYAVSINLAGGNITQGYVEFQVPANNVLAVGDGGTLTASYSVFRNAFLLGDSTSTEVILMIPKAGLNMMVSIGAPPVDKFYYPDLHTKNRSVIAGDAGALIHVSLDSAHVEIEGSSSQSAQIRLNENGLGYVNFVSSYAEGHLITAYNESNPSEIISGTVIFNEYIVDADNTEDIKGYGKTTNIPNDGHTIASIYLVCAKETVEKIAITRASARITSSSSAIFLATGEQELLNTPLNDDGTIEFQLVNTVAETVSVTVSLPESVASIIQDIEIVFMQFP